jgi:hypothetical protein
MADIAITSQALSTLTPAELSELDADRKKMGGSKYPKIPQIRLANTDMKQAPEGEYFIEVYKGKDEEPEVRQLGANPEMVILYKTSSYSYYTKEHGLVAWTSDIHGFSALDRVTLFVKRDGKVVIEKDSVYPEFKKYIQEKYTIIDPVTGDSKKLLKFKTILYVLFEGEPHKMFVSNASSAGVLDGNPSFDAPQELSLQSYLDACWREKRAVYEHPVRLGSQYVESSKPYYIMTFEPLEPLDDTMLRTAIQAKKATEAAILMLDDARRVGDTMAEESTDTPAVNYQSEVSVEDLPF